MPSIALFICAIFVLFLLRLEHKQSSQTTFALWIPTIWMLLMAMKPLGVWFWTGDVHVEMESGSPLDRNVLTVILIFGLIILASRQFNWTTSIKNNIWLILLICYMLVSVFWSDMPYISFKRWIREVVAIVMAFIIVTEPDPRQAVQSIFRRMIYVLIPFSYVLIHYFPELGRQYNRWSGDLMWIGVTTQKNGLGRLCLSAAFFLIWTLIRRWQGKDIPITRYQTFVEVFILILTLWLMGGPKHNFSYSVTTNVAFLVGLSTLIGHIWLKRRGYASGLKVFFFLVVGFVIVYGTTTPFVCKLSLIDISSMFGRDETLTGRNAIWETLIPYVMQKPIWGHGFGGFWTDEIRSITSSHAHNGYLDIILNIGFFGLMLWAIFLLSVSRKTQGVMTEDFDWGNLCFCFLLMTVVHNIAESSIAGFTGGLSSILLLTAVSLTTINNTSDNSSE